MLTHKHLKSVKRNRLSCLIDSFCMLGKLFLELGHSQCNQVDDQFYRIQQMSVVVDVAAIFSFFQFAKEELITVLVIDGNCFPFLQWLENFMGSAGNSSIESNQPLLSHNQCFGGWPFTDGENIFVGLTLRPLLELLIFLPLRHALY